MKEIFKKLPQKSRGNMLIADIISSMIIIVIAFIVKSVIHSFSIPFFIKKIVDGIFYMAIVFSVLDIILTQLIGYQRVKYLITEKSIEVYSGIFYSKHEIVPIRKMQQIDIEIGPINKLFHLASVRVITAGGSIELEYIEKEEAEEIAALLKDRINEFAKEEGGNEK